VIVAIPANLSLVTVTGTYIDISGVPIAGQVKFTPRAVLRNVTSNVILVNSTIVVTLDANGAFSQQLVATDDNDASPVNFTYFVEEAFTGGRQFDILLPAATPVIDLADVSPAIANDGTGALYISAAEFNDYEDRLTVVEGKAGAVETYLASLQSALATAISNSNNARTLVNSYVTSIGNIGDNGILYPSRAF
jgi:hypothetical protein